MRALVIKAKSSLPIRELALNLTRDLQQKDYASEVEKIHNFVRDKVRYVQDISNVETIQTPIKTLQYGAGDCDDKSMLVAALLESINHPTRFVAMGFNGEPHCHVYVETKLGTKWIGVETTEPVGLGWTPPNQTSRMVIYN
jgi:transglutaminase-like putative cysteine protease